MRVLLSVLLVMQIMSAQDLGGLYFQGNCTGCHDLYKDNAAPSAVAFVAVYKMHYPKKREFVSKMTDWLLDPHYDTSKHKEWVHEYGLMPKVLDDRYTLRAIASYLYEQY